MDSMLHFDKNLTFLQISIDVRGILIYNPFMQMIIIIVYNGGKK